MWRMVIVGVCVLFGSSRVLREVLCGMGELWDGCDDWLNVCVGCYGDICVL